MTKYATDPFYALADVNRREILRLLKKRKQNINALADQFDISRPAVSKHIKVLADAGFISISEIGRERYCELNKNGFEEITDWMNFFDGFWTNKVSGLRRVLEQRKKKKRAV